MNILEIIKKAPENHIYYNLMIGNVKVIIRENKEYPILCTANTLGLDCSPYMALTSEGRYVPTVGDTILFPSKDQRNWIEFEREVVKGEFKPFDKVLGRDSDGQKWTPDIFSYYSTEDTDYPYHCMSNSYNQCISYEGNEDKLWKE